MTFTALKSRIQSFYDIIATTVYYHGSSHLFKTPKLNALGVFWVTDDPIAAERYAKEFEQLRGNAHLYKVTLNPQARIANLNDKNDPVSKKLANYIETNRDSISSTFRKHKLTGPWWFTFEFLEENIDALDWLQTQTDGVKLTDVQDAYDHNSIALFKLGAINSLVLDKHWIAEKKP